MSENTFCKPPVACSFVVCLFLIFLVWFKCCEKELCLNKTIQYTILIVLIYVFIYVYFDFRCSSSSVSPIYNNYGKYS